MKSTRSKILVSSVLLGSLFSAGSYANELLVSIDNITKPKGVMMIGLYNTASGYYPNETVFTGQQVAVTGSTLTVKFNDLPSGEYAIKIFQDENQNGAFDRDIQGIPTESYGFSNNGGAMGLPSFDEAKFNLNENTTVTIHLR